MSLELLSPEFKPKAYQLLELCSQHGVQMVPYYTTRTPSQQARLWRQSRAGWRIRAVIKTLKKYGALYLAKVLEAVGPQSGPWRTNALPGLSWHNWGMAVDCYLLVDGHAVWDADHIGYQVYAQSAIELGLLPGYYWKSKDAVHVQFYLNSVRRSYTWAEIDRKMKQIHG